MKNSINIKKSYLASVLSTAYGSGGGIGITVWAGVSSHCQSAPHYLSGMSYKPILPD